MKLEDFRGHWALVTGASSGIGAEFCRQLAAGGINLVMVARRKPLLDALSHSLISAHGIQTLVLAIDLSERDSASRVKAATTQASIRVRLLINNAAFGPWGSFEKTSAQTYESMVQLIAATPISSRSRAAQSSICPLQRRCNRCPTRRCIPPPRPACTISALRCMASGIPGASWSRRCCPARRQPNLTPKEVPTKANSVKHGVRPQRLSLNRYASWTTMRRS